MVLYRGVLAVLTLLIFWDVATTYYGTLSLFGSRAFDVLQRIKETPLQIHAVAGMLAVGIVSFMLSYRVIFNASNIFTKVTVCVLFVYDFWMSLLGTAEVVGLRLWDWSNLSLMNLSVVVVLATITTASPLLIGHFHEQA